MPIYTFECECGERLEALMTFGEPPPRCPRCSGSPRKVVARACLRWSDGHHPHGEYSDKHSAWFREHGKKMLDDGQGRYEIEARDRFGSNGDETSSVTQMLEQVGAGGYEMSGGARDG
jgi:putative FmdB family regulatory protein